MPLKTVLFKKKNIWVQRICEKNYKIIGSKKTEMAYYMYILHVSTTNQWTGKF